MITLHYIMYISKVWILLVLTTVMISVNICAAGRTVSAYYGLVPNPDPSLQPHEKYYWVKSAMGKLPSKCPRGSNRAGNTPREVCSTVTEQRLGMENGDITDASITASTFASNILNGNVYRPQQARLNLEDNPKGWCPNRFDGNKWIQADLNAVMSVTGLITQGYLNDEHMKSYKVAYCDDGVSWIYITDPIGTPTVFTGNTDGDTHVYARFAEVIRARFVRIVPVTWTGGNDDCCMRFEVLGCK